MSAQAEYSVQLLMLFYAEFDQRSGWGDKTKVLKLQRTKGIADGRTENALDTLLNLKMLDQKVSDETVMLRLSTFGVDWFEKNFTLVERGQDAYRYEVSPFRKIRLVSPDQFYGRSSKNVVSSTEVNWTKWGAIFAGLGILVTIVLWKIA